MKRIIASLIAGIMIIAPSSALAEEDLEARVTALEERVAALEAQIGAPPEGVSAVQEKEPESLEDVETGMVVNGSSLSFKRVEVVKAEDGKDAVILYFDYQNESGKTSSAGNDFYVQIFQNGREMDSASVYDNQAIHDNYTEFRSGAGAFEIAVAREIQDMSDIIVNISSFTDWDVEDVEFTVSLE